MPPSGAETECYQVFASFFTDTAKVRDQEPLFLKGFETAHPVDNGSCQRGVATALAGWLCSSAAVALASPD
jgi:hypothetical protein